MKIAKFLVEFHEALREYPKGNTFGNAELRATLIEEEATEAIEALRAQNDLAHVAKELADLVYVAYGAAYFLGIPLDAVVAEVHRSNMTKLSPRAEFREDGKLLKGAQYQEADIEKVLNA